MSWQSYTLGDILKRKRATESLLPDKEYKLVTIKLYHKGVVLRKIVRGAEIGSSMSRINSGDFILSGIDARNGAFGIVPKELEGAVVTNDFWCLEPDERIIDKEFLLYLTSTDFFDYICKQSSDGTTQRIRLQKDKFFNYQINLPSKPEQKIILDKLKTVNSIGFSLSSALSTQHDLTKQLRQSFLREAMQGKLVKQDLKDGDARELLEKIKAEKVKSGKKEKELPPIKPEEIPFEIPENWVWCRLGDVVEMNRGRFSIRPRNDPSYFGGPHLFIQIGSLDEHGSVITEAPQTLNEKGYKVSKEFPTGTIAIAIVGGTIGNLGVLGKPMCFTDSIVGVLPSKSYNQEFILTFLRFVQPEIKKAAYQMAGQPNIKIPTLAELLIPFPPFSEQSRIVRRMGELMRLCDELQESIQTSKTQNEMLLQQLLKEALKNK